MIQILNKMESTLIIDQANKKACDVIGNVEAVNYYYFIFK